VTRRRASKLSAAVETAKGDEPQLERRFATDTLPVPPVVYLDGDRLVWRFDRKAMSLSRRMRSLDRGRGTVFEHGRRLWIARRVPVGDGLLRDFVQLAEVPAERIAGYARRWGVMGFCAEHRLPSCHPSMGDGRACLPEGWDEQGGWEAVEHWRFWSRRARAVMLARHRLQSDDYKWTGEEIRGLGGYVGVRKPPPKQGEWSSWEAIAEVINNLVQEDDEPDDTWGTLAVAVNDWLWSGDVRPRIYQNDRGQGRPSLVLAPPAWSVLAPTFPLFGIIGMQLSFAVCSEHGVAFCSACGKAFNPGRVLRQGVRHYCDECGRTAMNRDAARDSRARKRRRGSSAS